MKFSELSTDRLYEYLMGIGIPVESIEQAASMLTEKFNNTKKKAQHHTVNHIDEHFTGQHPFTKTKHQPRKTVFGKIEKITK